MIEKDADSLIVCAKRYCAREVAKKEKHEKLRGSLCKQIRNRQLIGIEEHIQRLACRR